MVVDQKGASRMPLGILHMCMQSFSFSNDTKEKTLKMETKANKGQVFNNR